MERVGGGVGRGKNVQLDSQSAVKSIVARASCFLQDRNTLEINLHCCISIPGMYSYFVVTETSKSNTLLLF